MALFVLRRIDMDSPAYDAFNGFVIRCNNHTRARIVASEHAGDEGPDVWKDVTRSTCVVLSEVGKEVVVMADFNAG